MTVSGANYEKYLSIFSAHYNPVAFIEYMIDYITPMPNSNVGN